MPFKLGAAPIRRTIKYLESGPLVFRNKVKCVMVNYNVDEETLYVKERPTLHPVRRAAMEKKPWWIRAGPEHKGAQDFAFWNLPQVQYKNPNVQIVVQRNMTPTPFITCFLDDGKIRKGMHGVAHLAWSPLATPPNFFSVWLVKYSDFPSALAGHQKLL